jgi:hypothetical protein
MKGISIMAKVFIRKFKLDSGFKLNSNGKTYDWIGYGKDPITSETIELKGSPKAIDIIVDSLIAEGYQLEAI